MKDWKKDKTDKVYHSLANGSEPNPNWEPEDLCATVAYALLYNASEESPVNFQSYPWERFFKPLLESENGTKVWGQPTEKKIAMRSCLYKANTQILNLISSA